MTLSQAAFGSDSLLKKVLLVLAGTVFVAIAAQISVPFFPVPLTLQTLAVLLIGLTYGSRLGAITLATYVLEGAAGLPVFANFGSTASLVGPTAGFIFGFILMAYIAGLVADRGEKRIIPMAIMGIIASVALYIPGVAWPMGVASVFGIDAGWVGTTADKIWAGWVSPFLLGDAVKAVLAALIVAGGWSVLKKN